MSEEQDVRLLQVFLGKNGTYEVNLKLPSLTDGPDLECNCPGWSVRHRCKHTAYIVERWSADDGYIVRLDESKETPTAEALSTPEAWRRFLITNAPVVVLE